MQKNTLLIILATVALASAVWTYSGLELKDNQVLMFITGTEITPDENIARERTITASEEGRVIQVNGKTAACEITKFTEDSQAGGKIDHGYLVNGVDLPQNGPYIQIGENTLEQDRHWGTVETINSLEIAGCAVLAKTGSKIQVNDLSSRTGGKISRHKSHQSGLDADLRLMCNNGAKIYPCADANQFDVEANWGLVRNLALNTPVHFIFLGQSLIDKLRTYAEVNEPEVALVNGIFTGTNRLLRHEHNHNNHFHVRFHCDLSDRNCEEQGGGYKGGPETPEPIVGDEEVATVFNDAALLAKVTRGARNPAACLMFDLDLNPIIEHCSLKYGINEDLMRAIILAESGGNCNYKGGDPFAVSTKNARGLMQVLDKAAEDVNEERQVDEKYNYKNDIFKPSINICSGTQYLALLFTRYGVEFGITDTNSLVHAYNVGPAGYRDGTRNDVYLEMVRDRYFSISTEPWPLTPERSGLTISRKGDRAIV